MNLLTLINRLKTDIINEQSQGVSVLKISPMARECLQQVLVVTADVEIVNLFGLDAARLVAEAEALGVDEIQLLEPWEGFVLNIEWADRSNFDFDSRHPQFEIGDVFKSKSGEFFKVDSSSGEEFLITNLKTNQEHEDYAHHLNKLIQKGDWLKVWWA